MGPQLLGPLSLHPIPRDLLLNSLKPLQADRCFLRLQLAYLMSLGPINWSLLPFLGLKRFCWVQGRRAGFWEVSPDTEFG